MNLKDYKMSKISKSPERHSFQKEGYVKRQEERGEPVNEDYLDWFEKIQEQHDHKFDDPQSHVNNMEYDLLTTDWILAKVRESDTYAQNLYAAMCNNDFQKLEVMPILKEEVWHCSWRYAGGIIADMQEKGDYIDWYCSGIGDGLGNGDSDGSKGYVSESVVTVEIREDLKQLGWIVVDWKNDE
jgi:hypothetical protein